jgi:hypothetical protein
MTICKFSQKGKLFFDVYLVTTKSFMNFVHREGNLFEFQSLDFGKSLKNSNGMWAHPSAGHHALYVVVMQSPCMLCRRRTQLPWAAWFRPVEQTLATCATMPPFPLRGFKAKATPICLTTLLHRHVSSSYLWTPNVPHLYALADTVVPQATCCRLVGHTTSSLSSASSSCWRCHEELPKQLTPSVVCIMSASSPTATSGHEPTTPRHPRASHPFPVALWPMSRCHWWLVHPVVVDPLCLSTATMDNFLWWVLITAITSNESHATPTWP